MTTSNDKLARIIDSLVKKSNTTTAGVKATNRSVVGVDEFVGIFDLTRTVRLEQVVVDGLIFYLPFDSRAQITADAWREAADSGVNYATDDASNMSTRIVVGKIANGLDIMGATSTSVTIECPPLLAPITDFGGLSAFTVELWVYLNTWNDIQIEEILRLNQITGETAQVSIGLSQTGLAYMDVLTESAAGSWGGIAGSTPLSTGVWHHLCGTYSVAQGGGILYVDNVSVATHDASDGAFAPTTTEGYVRVFTSSIDSVFVDEVKIYNRALTAGEVQINYENTQSSLLGDIVLGEFIVL